MAKRGRPPKPTAIKLLEGTRADRINTNEPPTISGRPEPPDHLTETARQEWNRLVPLLERMNVLSQTDGTALATYCVWYARWAEAEIQIKRSGLVVTSATGATKISPFVQISKDAMREMQRMLTEFGCTPASRSRLKAEPPKPKTDALTAFLERRKHKS